MVLVNSTLPVEVELKEGELVARRSFMEEAPSYVIFGWKERKSIKVKGSTQRAGGWLKGRVLGMMW